MAEAAIARLNSLTGIDRGGASVREASLSVLPDAAKFVFRGRPSSWSAIGEAFRVELPKTVNRFNASGDRKAYCLGPDEWLLEAVAEDPVRLHSELASKLGGHACSLVDVSHRSDGLAISGSMSDYVLNHGCPLDLSEQQFPVGMCTRTLLGKSPIVLSRTAPEVFQIDVWRSFSMYVWAFLDDARQEFLIPQALT
ncbi:sarcosine oxidase subunit gamma [Bradyrhizobium sp.]|uniref:sarcosine oxidase subunit gamma n=1 Tax=Bradyrhizobium sp. TaxID=376 RepID=UPI0039E3F0CC